MGSVMGVLGQRAEQVYFALDTSGKEAARQMFLRLITLGEGIEDTRRRALRSELASISHLPPEPGMVGQGQGTSAMEAAIEAFGKSRLLSFDRDPLTRSPTVEVAHEALLREWKRLREWLDASRIDVRLQRQLAAGASEWADAKQEASFLLQGARLAQFEDWATGGNIALTQEERLFLNTSLAERQKRHEEEAARQRRELVAAQSLADAQRQRAEAEERRAQEKTRAAAKLSRLAVILILALFVAGVLAVAAAGFARDAIQKTRLAASRELAAAAVNNLDVDPERSVLLALEALSKADTLEARNALHQALPDLHILRTISAHTSAVTGVAYSPDGTLIATSSADKTVKVWDAASGMLRYSLTNQDVIWDVSFSPDGKFLATSGYIDVTLWDTATGNKLFTLSGASPGAATGFDIGVGRVDFSPDGTRLAVADMDGVPKVWDLSTRSVALELAGHKTTCKAIAYSPDGKLLATGSDDGVVKLWDSQTGQERFSLTGNKPLVRGVAFSPDGTRLVSIDEGSVLKVWEVATGKELLNLDTLSAGGFRTALFMPDGKRLVVVGYDGMTRLVDAATGRLLLTLAGHTSTVTDAAIRADGLRLATVGADGTLKVWDPGPGRELFTFQGQTSAINGIAYNPTAPSGVKGDQLATASEDGTVKIWDPGSGQLLRSLDSQGHPQAWSSLAYSPDGMQVAAGSNDGAVSIWDVATGQPVISLASHTNMVRAIAFSPDGQRLASGSLDGTAKVWDLKSGQVLTTFRGHIHPEGTAQTNAVYSLAFSPDGKHVASGGFDAVRLWDSSTGQELLSMPGEGAALIFISLCFSPDGKLLAIGQFNSLAVLRDVATGQLVSILSGHSSAIPFLTFSPDGSRLATASFDRLVKVWDVKTGQEMFSLYGNTSNVNSVSFSPDGTRLAAGGVDAAVRIYTLRMQDLLALARSHVTRKLTLAECQKYLHVEQCPAP